MLRKLLHLVASTAMLGALIVATPAQASQRQPTSALQHEIAQAYHIATRDLRDPALIPAGPQIPNGRCLRTCKGMLKHFRSDYNWWFLNKTCSGITTYLCKHPTPILIGSTQVNVCHNYPDCTRSMALAIDRHYGWLLKHGGAKQFADLWKCGAKPLQPCHPDCLRHKPCQGITDWIPFINFGGQLVGYGCILLTEGIGALICSGATATIVTVLDQVLSKSNAKDKGAQAFKNGLSTAGPFLVGLVKEILKKLAYTEGNGS